MSFSLMLWCPGSQVKSGLLPLVVNMILTKSQSYLFVHVLSMAMCKLQRQSWASVTGPKFLKCLIFTILPFILKKEACPPLVYVLVWTHTWSVLFPADEHASGKWVSLRMKLTCQCWEALRRSRRAERDLAGGPAWRSRLKEAPAGQA